jgi:GMP synthase (glutamine-hydrolysing)
VKYDEADLLRMYRIIRDSQLPILGICGGLQLIAMAHGAALGPMRRLQEGEADPNPGFACGYFKEWGFVPMRIQKPDPLFECLGQAPVFLEAHYWDVKGMPPGFELLASSDACRIQAIRRTGQLVYGTQFHPEAYIAGEEDFQNWLVNLVYPEGHTEPHPDGRGLLANFFTLAGVA